MPDTVKKSAKCPSGDNLQQGNLALMCSTVLCGHIITLNERNCLTLRSNCTLTLQL